MHRAVGFEGDEGFDVTLGGGEVFGADGECRGVLAIGGFVGGDLSCASGFGGESSKLFV